MPENVYRLLQQRLDTYSMGFPATESGIELKILRHLFSEDDAGLFLALTPRLEAPEAASARIGRPVEQIAARLEDMARRGLLFRLEADGRVKYGAIPFVHGLFEFQVKNLDRELAEMVGRYSEEAFDRAMQQSADYFLRTVPVQRSVDLTQHIASHEDAVAMLRSKPSIVVTDCICRKKMDIVEGACAKPLEACFMFGSMGQYYLDRGMGRKIDVEEAVSILSKCQEAGLVTQPSTSQNPAGMCNCCGDCCGVLRALNRHPRPAELVFSNHYAVVDRHACSGCEACLERCQMNALKMADDGTAAVDRDRCIGCGLCVTTCPTEALKLAPKSGESRRVPPATTAEQMLRMAQKRGLV
jgi:Pyruvate/2-oxoacid:ferredoxin oxidoreductase delta subunit